MLILFLCFQSELATDSTPGYQNLFSECSIKKSTLLEEKKMFLPSAGIDFAVRVPRRAVRVSSLKALKSSPSLLLLHEIARGTVRVISKQS